MLLLNRTLSTFGIALLAILACKPRSTSNLESSPSTNLEGVGSFPIWAYDPGPSLATSEGRSLIDLYKRIPYFPGLSMALYGEQFFRPAFGPIPWRMMQEPNSVQILFIGQDGTHIAEAAGRPATAGFGGRAQDLAAYFGVSSSAAFINTYAYTIKWQYGVFDAPAVVTSAANKPSLQLTSFVPSHVWLMSQDKNSPIAKWRNDLIEWIILNNKKSLKMIVLFGGAARDAMGAFVESRGGKVGARYDDNYIKRVKLAEFNVVPAGGNKQASVMLDKSGNPMYEAPNAEAFKTEFNANPTKYMDKVAFSQGGISSSGLIHPAQLGGYDIAKKMEIAGKKTISLNGLKLTGAGLQLGAWTIDHDILVTQLPHPTALSMMKPDEAATKVAQGLEAFKDFPDWKINAEGKFENKFEKFRRGDKEAKFDYGRGDMGPEYYDFGAPKSRMVNVSSASRSSFDTIVFGTRDKVSFDSPKLAAMRDALPEDLEALNKLNEVFLTRASSQARLKVFDHGPPEDIAKLMKSSLPQDEAFKNLRSVNGDYAHYRGVWQKAEVLIIADPHGEDDLVTARALTGSRGQLMHDFLRRAKISGSAEPVGEKYLILKTVPYHAKNTSPELWDESVTATRSYRDAVVAELLKRVKPKVVILDGHVAISEFKRMAPETTAKIWEVPRDQGGDPAEGLSQLAKNLGVTYTGKMADIPRSHLTYYARVWEGTSGDRVITAKGAAQGKAFAFVAPSWAYNQRFALSLRPDELKDCQSLFSQLVASRTRLNFKETVPSYYDRVNRGQNPADPCNGRAGQRPGSPNVSEQSELFQDDGHTVTVNLKSRQSEQYVPEEPDWDSPKLQLPAL